MMAIGRMNRLLLCLLLAACGQGPGDGPQAPQVGADDIAANNRGVALMGQFDYGAARDTFAGLVERQPDWNAARVNLAIATLNRQEPGDEQEALRLLDEVLAADPDNLRAHYVAGLLSLYRGETDAGRAHFETVARGDPHDAYAAYYLAQSLLQSGEIEATLPWYERAIERDPYLRSAYYGAALALRRLGRTGEARDMLAQYERFKDNPRASLAEFKYTRMGPKADAAPIGDPDAQPPVRIEGPLFGAAVRQDVSFAAGVGLTTGDLDGDGRQDLFLARGGTLPGEVLLGGDDGVFTQSADHPLAAVTGVVAALWGDVDNDGFLDAYLCRRGPNQLWRQTAPGQWRDDTAASRTANGDLDCAAAALFDADHDGDLDLFIVNEDGPSELLNNDLDGGFRPLAADHGLTGRGSGRGVVVADLDRDRDADIVVIRAEPPHEVYANDRLWRYEPARGFDAFRAQPALAAVAGDADADGRPELYTLDAAGSLRRWQAANGEWSPRVLAEVPPSKSVTLALQDFDGDGAPELLVTRQGGFSVFALTGDVAEPVFEQSADLAALLPVLDEPRRGPSLIGLESAGEALRLTRWPPGSGRYAFVALRLTGRNDRGESMRSNASGIGTEVALRVGSRWSLLDSFDHDSAPGQSLEPVAIGLGGAKRADYVALYWSDGVFQTELDLEPGGLQRIAETQRQLASCPVLFAFDGTKYEFVSDLLGVGGLGFLVAPGEYAEPRPWEFFRLPSGLTRPRAGRYAFKLTEPMEETAYVDGLRLHVYDLPPGWSMAVDERFGLADPQPTGAPIFYRRALTPGRAVNGNGENVTAALLARDLVAAPVGALDRRFIGLLESPQVLTLEFAEPLDAGAGRPVLVADGWIEYPYSQTVFAAWQAGARYEAPTLEARGGDGVWQVVEQEFGYPAGMPREMALPLDRLPAGSDALRISTNQEIYWDRIRVVRAEPLPDARATVLGPVLGELRRTGFALRTSRAPQAPHYDYALRQPVSDSRYQTGFYTRFGDVLPLIQDVDDALAILGPGEETQFEFAAPAPPPAGWQRELVLEARGWAKDMDLYTEHGETVGPLPLRDGAAGAAGPRDALHARYNVRFQAGR